MSQSIAVRVEGVELEGDLVHPEPGCGTVLFAHGSGSSRHSPRNRFVAASLNQMGLGTLLIDLLSQEEERIDAMTAHLRFDIGLLARRLTSVVDWLAGNEATRSESVGLFGASTGAAAALVTAAERPARISAVVSRGGRPDLGGAYLPQVTAPTLLIVGGNDTQVIMLNRQALAELASAEKRLEIVPGASHLFEEPGALDQVARLAANWFTDHMSRGAALQAA